MTHDERCLHHAFTAILSYAKDQSDVSRWKLSNYGIIDQYVEVTGIERNRIIDLINDASAARRAELDAEFLSI